MAEKYRHGQASVHLWIDATIKQAWQEFASTRGRALREEILEAMARHMKFPSAVPEPAPPPVVPLPDAAPKRGRGRPKKIQNNS